MLIPYPIRIRIFEFKCKMTILRVLSPRLAFTRKCRKTFIFFCQLFNIVISRRLRTSRARWGCWTWWPGNNDIDDIDDVNVDDVDDYDDDDCG